jgi:hypothetical protein
MSGTSFFKSFIYLAVSALYIHGADATDYDSIAVFFTPGPPTVPVLSVITDTDQLNDYCSEVQCETPLSADFSTVMVIGLLTMTGGGNRVYLRKLQRVIDEPDSIILEVKPDSQMYDPDISIQAAYTVFLFSIPQSGKPVALRESLSAATQNPFSHRTPRSATGYRTAGRSYDVKGRTVSGARTNHTGVLITFDNNGVIRRVTVQQQRR